MKKALILLSCALTSSWAAAQLTTPRHFSDVNSLLALFSLVILAAMFYWHSFSHLLLAIAKTYNLSTVLRYVARFGSPKARHIAVSVLLLAPTPAFAAADNHPRPPEPRAVSQEYAPAQHSPEQHSSEQTPQSLRRRIIAPHDIALAAPTSLPAQSTVTVLPGDCLWSIANRLFPNLSDSELSTKVLDLWEANRETISEPNLIHPGQQIFIPTHGK